MKEETLKQYIEKHGARKTAMKLVSDRIFIHSGLTVRDLPDTSELCSMYDEIEQLLDDYTKDDLKSIVSILDEIDYDFVNNLIYS